MRVCIHVSLVSIVVLVFGVAVFAADEPPSSAQRVWAVEQLAKKLADNGKLVEAVDLLRQEFIKRQGTAGAEEALEELMDLLLQRRRFDGAIAAFEELVPHVTDTRQRAHIHYSFMRNVARRLLVPANCRPQHAEVWEFLKRELERFVADFSDLHLPAERLAKVYGMLGSLNKDTGNYEAAIEFYRRSLATSSDSAELLAQHCGRALNLANCLYFLDRCDEAEAVLLDLMERTPNSDVSRAAEIYLGDLYHRCLGDEVAAEFWYDCAGEEKAVQGVFNLSPDSLEKLRQKAVTRKETLLTRGVDGAGGKDEGTGRFGK